MKNSCTSDQNLRVLNVSLIVVILCLLGYMIAMGGPVRWFSLFRIRRN